MNSRDLKTGLVICLLALQSMERISAVERKVTAGAREAALSLAVVALPGSFAVFHNQALLTENKTLGASICYRNPYSIPGYHESTLSLALPIPAAVFALGVSQHAVDRYCESNFGIALAKRLSKKLSAGLLFNYFDLNLPETGHHKGSIQVDGGIGYKYSEKLYLGFHLKNIVQSKIKTFQYELSFPIEISGGISRKLTDRILLLCEAVFERKIGIGCGLEYQLLNNFFVRGGISANPFQHAGGFGYSWRHYQFDFALVHHETLGYTPSFSINFNVKR